MPVSAATLFKLAEPVEADPRWQAVLARDGAQDGTFYYSVASTGIYCRPSCPSRRPAPRHVAFHASCDAAEAAGFRACRRCHPRGPSQAETRGRLIAAAARALSGDKPPPLARLAARARLSPFHFHRLFREATGLTPRQFAEARREARVRAELSTGDSVTGAIYAAGYGSPRRFYERADAMLGMSPQTYRKGGAALEIGYAIGQTSLGKVLVAATARGVCAVLFGDSEAGLSDDLNSRFPQARITAGGADFAATLATVLAYLDQPRPGVIDLPLDLVGTAFQQRVWQALRTIPPGTTISYAALAERLGEPRAVRAVAGACTRNPVAVAVPCHRIVRSDGGLSGYRWGVERKRALIAREQQ